MTERLYYADASLRAFEGVVRECRPHAGRMQVVLDRTAFYPTSGGQPFDVGRLGDVDVIEVLDAEDGGVVHVTSGALEVGTSVRGTIDWVRRFDHMQQHTGQHVLSAAIARTCDVDTVSFHLGAEACTIDLAREVTATALTAAEDAANQMVWDDRAVRVRFVEAEEAARLPLRKETHRTGPVRLVEVEDVDLSACGGTHVSSTGAIGQIAVGSSERFKGGTRVTFVCGGRALASHRRMRDIVLASGRLVSCGADELVPQIERRLAEAREQQRRVDALTADVVRWRANEWREAAETIGVFRGVLRSDPSADVPTLKAMAHAILADQAGMVVVLVGGGDPAPVVVARSADVSFDAGGFVRAMTTALGGRGGGRAELAQGGVAAGGEAVLAFARQALGA